MPSQRAGPARLFARRRPVRFLNLSLECRGVVRGGSSAIAVGLADVATLAAAREEWQPAARLFARAEALMRAEAAAFSLPAHDHYERAHDRAREALGDAAYQVAAAAGRALTLEQGLAEAEAVLELERDEGALPVRAMSGCTIASVDRSQRRGAVPL